jgi:hypothetical protein
MKGMTMSTNFTPPPPPGADGDNFEIKMHKGALVLIEVLGTKLVEGTKFGDKDAIRANVAVLDGENKGNQHADALLFPSVIYGQLKGMVGQKVLARIGQGENKKGNPPWLLEAPTEADVATAQKFEAYVATKAAATDDPF